MSDGPADDGHPADLDRTVRRHRDRRADWQKHGERSLGANLLMIGALGWLIVLPMLGGVFVGRWLDRLAGSGITFTAALLLLGLGLGCRLAWQRMHKA